MSTSDLIARIEAQVKPKLSRFPGGCVLVIVARQDKDGPPYLHFTLAQEGAYQFSVDCIYSIQLIEKAGTEIIVETLAKNLQLDLFRKITGL